MNLNRYDSISIAALLLAASICPLSAAEPKPVPRMQAIPLPDEQVSLLRDGRELARYHYGAGLRRPFVFPIVGPSGRSLTRMGHPHDPITHSHHNSVWVSHHDVNGVDFWGDHGKGKGRIVHQRIESFVDSDERAALTAVNAWIDDARQKTLLVERRRLQVEPLAGDEWLLVIDLDFTATEPVTLGKTPFGLVGVRMAKTIGVNDGGGTIRNSEGQVDEKEVFWKPAKWVDYSGPITPKSSDGVTLFDHPANPNYPSVFHVRNDGWMGASVTFAGPRVIDRAQPLRLRYALYVHAGQPPLLVLESRWADFARTALDDLAPKKAGR